MQKWVSTSISIFFVCVDIWTMIHKWASLISSQICRLLKHFHQKTHTPSPFCFSNLLLLLLKCAKVLIVNIKHRPNWWQISSLCSKIINEIKMGGGVSMIHTLFFFQFFRLFFEYYAHTHVWSTTVCVGPIPMIFVNQMLILIKNKTSNNYLRLDLMKFITPSPHLPHFV